MSTAIPQKITKTAVTTLWYDNLTSALAYKLPYELPAHTTLNEKLMINPSTPLPANTYPSVGYFAVGDKGHLMTPIVNTSTGEFEDVNISTIQHLPTHAALYNQKPFVVRKVDNDLISSERAKYALRKKIAINSVDYYAYYLKRLDLNSAERLTVQYTQSNGVETATPYAPDASSLNPQQIIPNSQYANNLLGTYVRNSIKYTIAFNSADMQEYVSACQLLGQSMDSVKISELAICSGLDYTVAVDSNGSSVQFNEAIGVQIAHYAPVFNLAVFASTGFEVSLLVGMNRALFIPENVTP
jgi:hypothetical protein